MPSSDVKINGYDLYERLGAGAESVIYRAHDIGADRVVAIKYVVADTKENYKYLRHAENEYETLKMLEDGPDGMPEGIVRVYRILRSGRLRRRKECALVMQYVEGLDLRRERRYPLGQMLEILRRVADSLAAIHARSIIHGNLKPENIIVNDEGLPTIVDFGFSCPVGARQPSIRGTRDYMAPEQVDRLPLTHRTDIYNFGATMYFLLTGRHVPALIAQPGDEAHFISGPDAQAQPVRSFEPRVPKKLDDIVMRCIRKDMAARPARMTEVRDVLAEIGERFFS